MKKKALVLLLAVSLMFAAMPVLAAEGKAPADDEIESRGGFLAPTYQIFDSETQSVLKSAPMSIRSAAVTKRTERTDPYAKYGCTYYYSLMTAEEQAFYDRLYETCLAVMTGTETYYSDIPSVYEDSLTSSEAFHVIDFFRVSEPQFYYLGNSVGVGNNVYYDISIMQQFWAGEARAAATKAFFAQAEIWLEDINKEPTVLEKERRAHDLIAENVVYDLDYMVIGQSAYSVMVTGRTVCAGYATAFQMLANASGIPTVCVTGTSERGMAHEWCESLVDGIWYGVDVTWDDLDPGVRYSYFNLDEEQMNSQHNPSLEWDGYRPICGQPSEALDENPVVALDEVNFPDAEFRAYLDRKKDRNGDGILSAMEIRLTRMMDCSGWQIGSFAGIRYFRNLNTLLCSSCGMTELDLSEIPWLLELHCSGNELQSLDVSMLPELKTLSCGSNQLSLLDLSANPKLIELSCGGNQLTALNITQNAALQILYCGYNQLTELDLSGNPSLAVLGCGNNRLGSLDISSNPYIFDFNCENNQLTELNLDANTRLCQFICSNNQISNLELSQCESLNWVRCENNCLKNLDLRQNLYLTEVRCDYNQLVCLDLRANMRVYNFSCLGNSRIVTLSQDGTFDISTLEGFDPACVGDWQGATVNGTILTLDEGVNRARYVYDCGNTNLPNPSFVLKFQRPGEEWHDSSVAIDEQHFPDPIFREFISTNFDLNGDETLSETEADMVTTIDVSCRGISDLTGISSFLNLNYLSCSGNALKELDLTKNTSLQILDCGDNEITDLDVSQNLSLAHLCCYGNSLKKLNLDNNTRLGTLQCWSNQLTELDVSNCSMLNHFACEDNQLQSLDISKNPELRVFACNRNHLTSLDLSAQGVFSRCDCNNNSMELPMSIGGTVDLSDLPGFDVSKASNWVGGSVSGTVLTPYVGVRKVTYTYDVGNSNVENPTFTLDLREKTIGLEQDVDTYDSAYLLLHCACGASVYPLPGGEDGCDFNGDGAFNENDALWLFFHEAFDDVVSLDSVYIAAYDKYGKMMQVVSANKDSTLSHDTVAFLKSAAVIRFFYLDKDNRPVAAQTVFTQS